MKMKKASPCQGMVDVSAKEITRRRAVATAAITLSKAAFQAFLKSGSPKGDVFESARIAGIMAAKLTPVLVPHCHPLALEKVIVTFETLKAKSSVRIQAEVICTGKTGVEMEALTAASAAALTIYDMMKWAGQDMQISDIRLLHKSGGRSGNINRKI